VRDRKTCDQGSGEAKLTDSGRKVYGGDGITPDYCVEPETPAKFVSYLIGRQAFTGFARRFESEGGRGQAEIVGTGKRSQAASAKVRFVSKDFRADDAVLAEFRGYLDSRKLRHTPADFEQNQVAIVRLIEDEVLRQAISEGEARRRSVTWDPQIRKALDLVPRAEMLLRDPKTFVAERAREKRVADAAAGLRAQQ
jgi:carboxyl-terminal processing protease